MSDAELLRDLTQVVFCCSLVLHHACAADYLKVCDLRKIGKDFILHAIGEKGVRLIRAQIFKGKDGNAFRGNRRRNVFFCCYLGNLLRSSTNKDRHADYQGEGRQKQSDDECSLRPDGRRDWPNGGAGSLLPPFSASQFFRQSRIAEAILVEINNMKPPSVFNLTLANVM